MKGLFQRTHESAGEAQELRRVLARLKQSGARVRLAVGSGVHLANSEFIRRYGGMESFRKASQLEQKLFCSELSDLELGSRARAMGVALGVGLYRIWLSEMLADRSKVAEALGHELTELSRRSAG